MDADMIALAATAGEALVQAMVTDGWTTVRQRCARILGAGDPGRQRQVEQQLATTHAALQSGDISREIAVVQWQGRVESALHANPARAAELAALIAELRPTTTTNLRQQASAGPRSTIDQVGRDQHNSDNRKHFGGPLAVIAVIVVVLLLGFGATKVFV